MKISKKLALMLKSILSLKLGSVATDQGEIFWDAEDDLQEGMEVFIRVEGDEFQPAPSGDYLTEDGKVIKVVDGKVSEIVDNKAEVAEEVEEEIQQEENEEVEPADEPEQEEGAGIEERVNALEARLAEFTDGLNAILNAISGIENRIAAVEEKLAAVEKPGADPIDEQPEVQEHEHKSPLGYLRK